MATAEIVTARALVTQVSEDLAWLEEHCRQQAEYAHDASRVRLAAALARNVIGPFLDNQAPTPLHIVVVGGAGAGKSTLSNLLSGAPAAEANPQAGFTRHPIAYVAPADHLRWTGYNGFLGPLQRLAEPGPSSIDRDVYQVRRVPPEPGTYDILKDFVVWDCPDMTTWASSGYVNRLIEAAALADVVVYAASDERYNDEMPTQFLHLLLQAGKPVVCVLMKMRESDAAALVAHFQKEVVAQMPPGVVGCLAIPYLKPEELADPARMAGRYRIPLLNQVAVLGASAANTRQRTVLGALAYLTRHLDQLLAVARRDLLALQSWQSTVQAGRLEFESRYQREYLTSEKFRGFDDALVQLMQLLELPGIGRILSGALYVIRTPFRLLKNIVQKAITRPDAGGRADVQVLEEALTGWIDLLRKEAARQADTHPLWAHIVRGFHEQNLEALTRERFRVAFREFQQGLSNEVDRTARAIYEELAKRPILLNSLRGSKFALDAAAIAGTIAAGGINWHDLYLIPLVAALSNQLVELMGRQFVDAQREQTRLRQQALLTEFLSGPMSEWLTQWPATGGSSFERLQQALRRLPEGVRRLNEFVALRLQTPT